MKSVKRGKEETRGAGAQAGLRAVMTLRSAAVGV